MGTEDVRRATVTFNQPVAIGTALPTFVRITAHPNLLGRLAGLLFRPAPLTLAVQFADGHRHLYQFITGIGEAGFVMSPSGAGCRRLRGTCGRRTCSTRPCGGRVQHRRFAEAATVFSSPRSRSRRRCSMSSPLGSTTPRRHPEDALTGYQPSRPFCASAAGRPRGREGGGRDRNAYPDRRPDLPAICYRGGSTHALARRHTVLASDESAPLRTACDDRLRGRSPARDRASRRCRGAGSGACFRTFRSAS